MMSFITFTLSIKSSRIWWTEHIARIKKRNIYKLFVLKSERKRPLGNQDVSGWIILKWILERQEGWYEQN
jgi:hypothetical protein